ncbi:LCM-domain-containing protein [Penicillium lagena]|uniref:LCM-domain-containing protein n=1 Tax=Penicillium lagena TaxID=94218 RepID=UPI00254153D5|nr:LCM-domain-containing protein [Penicillium lagena]KAJ5620421.1 LCM-domain-containing protein [Penicillium lagena]
MAPRPAMASSQAEKEAEVMMAINNGSIVSKRSVEMIYYPEPHFFRPFVKKPQKRAPLINRGYWLRMHAMTESVRRFIDSPSDKPKFVVNLGCGFDPLPFMLLSDERRSMRNGQTVFVDIDYEKLMVHKKIAIRRTQEIADLLGDVEYLSDESPIQIRSSRYLAVGCDLKNLTKLEDVMRNHILPSTDCSVLCLAEVSLTYMDVQSSNAVISWASKLTPDMKFCILEKFAPDGPDRPFVSTMVKHYRNCRTPLHSIHAYPSLADQERRFKDAGWPFARARSLWDLWSDNSFLPESTRTGLDKLEVFDEWEELALSLSHHFLLIASTTSDVLMNSPKDQRNVNEPTQTSGSCVFVLQPYCSAETRGQRRFGALIPDGTASVGHHGGVGPQTRLASTDLYSSSSVVTESRTQFPRDITARVCHTVTTLDAQNGTCLLVGGRASPAAPFNDCWLRHDNVWRQTHPLPEPRFRHSAISVSFGDGLDMALIYGGRSKGNQTLNSWLLWSNDDEKGWQIVDTDGPQPEARFGACLAKVQDDYGIMFGGIGHCKTILEDIWTWKLSRASDGSPKLTFADVTSTVRNVSPRLFPYLNRFGATVTTTSFGVVVSGGIIPRQTIPASKEILLLDLRELRDCITTATPCTSALITCIGLGDAFPGPQPLLIGHAACTTAADEVLILGGGAVCFSFGTFWNEGTWLLKRVDSTVENTWSLAASAPKVYQQPQRPAVEPRGPDCVKSAPRIRIKSATQFQQVVAKGQPVIIEGSDIGPCTELWTKEYLTDAVGRDRKIVVHAAQSDTMSFQAKNFSYVTKEFGTFLDEVHAGGRQYLRSISVDQPSKLPADLATDFPGLQNDFCIPEPLALVTENAHSSPLRISGPVTMWLHYDVMANVLCQVRGDRRLILFPPDDVQNLSLPAGASSSTIDIFQSVGADSIAGIPGTSPQEAVLGAGDILFIPPLWLHTACSTTGPVSVAVNVFFRNLRQGYAAGRDVYGNRDLQAYEKSRQDLQKMARLFDGVPPDMARFYLRRLAQELQGMADQS